VPCACYVLPCMSICILYCVYYTTCLCSTLYSQLSRYTYLLPARPIALPAAHKSHIHILCIIYMFLGEQQQRHTPLPLLTPTHVHTDILLPAAHPPEADHNKYYTMYDPPCPLLRSAIWSFRLFRLSARGTHTFSHDPSPSHTHTPAVHRPQAPPSMPASGFGLTR